MPTRTHLLQVLLAVICWAMLKLIAFWVSFDLAIWMMWSIHRRVLSRTARDGTAAIRCTAAEKTTGVLGGMVCQKGLLFVEWFRVWIWLTKGLTLCDAALQLCVAAASLMSAAVILPYSLLLDMSFACLICSCEMGYVLLLLWEWVWVCVNFGKNIVDWCLE